MAFQPLTLFSVLLLLHLSPVIARPYPAARCLFRGPGCTQHDSELTSGLCQSGLAATAQPPDCVSLGCEYCNRREHFRTRFPCNSDTVAFLCGFSQPESDTENNMNAAPDAIMITPTVTPTPSSSSTPSPSPSISSSPSPSASPATPTPVPSGCVWTGSSITNDTVIDPSLLSASSLTPGWTHAYRDGLHGLIYKKTQASGLSRPTPEGALCFTVSPPQTGKYYLTALTYAGHRTEHNDMWVTSTKGLELWRRRVMRTYVEPMEYRKGYQNQGPDNGIANFLMNIDHDPHTFIVPNVTKEEEFEVCIHGRSTRFEVFRVVLVKCEGYRCIGGRYHDIAERETSPCV